MLLMEHNQIMIAAINHQRLIRIKFQEEAIFWQSGARFSGRCRFMEV